MPTGAHIFLVSLAKLKAVRALVIMQVVLAALATVVCRSKIVMACSAFGAAAVCGISAT